MRLAQALLLFLAIALQSPQACAGCACGSAGASYDFLADPAVDINMPAPEEFVSAGLGQNFQPYADFFRDYPEEDTANTSKLSIDLDPGGHVDLMLFRSGDELSGSGNMTRNNLTSEMSARGSFEDNMLKLDMVSLSGDLYKLELGGIKPHLTGKYVAFSSDGETWSGNATCSEVNL